ncbi:DEAD/DEAH box family ATP-dependent RNA helicase [Fulvitalea axinellae]|uniref:DEAD/DEAH box family ATP-dependent RNA helicase n=1 Tax=Fulvitalea axinellae TaxID=1182444 RepID=A0AAU9CJ10_9BACT|nr:DEAD/DEAH box family ATP-dependent RNA helicase [Fulvitalea axinellae]
MSEEKINPFEQFKLNRQILSAVEDAGYDAPTEIQSKAIPLVSSGHDLLGIAQTGTGKTAAFVLPILMKIKYADGDSPRALILAPTRELVMQIDDNITLLAKNLDVRHTAIYGGIGAKTQIEKLREGVDILVSTPGRFLDLYGRGELVTKRLNTMVLDEADKMMDMGFMPQIRRILEVIPVKRQNLLFSATFPPRVEELTQEFLEFPEKVEVAPQATAAETVEQSVYQVPNFLTKINLLGHLLADTERYKRVIVFANTRTNADNLSKYLIRKGEGEVRVIHANKGQNSRTNAIEAFKRGEVRALVTTDVSARGIDVTDVDLVVNFDVPPIYEDYVHRVGRTGRAGKSGKAVTFANEYEMIHFHRIENVIRMEVPVAQIPSGVKVEKTPFEEGQTIARAVDDWKKKLDPTYKGAFHEKKKKPADKTAKGRGGRNVGGKLSKSAKKLYGAATQSSSKRKGGKPKRRR